MDKPQTRVMFVCMGNICRSPAAECFFRRATHDANCAAQFIVSSSGTGGWHVGSSPDGRMIEAAQKHGWKIEGQARQLTVEDLASFDWFFCMDKDNLNHVLALGADPGKTKLLLPFIGSKDPSEVPDPYYGGEDGFESVVVLINKAAVKLVDLLV